MRKTRPSIKTPVDRRDEFIHGLGLELEAEGFSPIAGRILGLLILSADPISFGDLATQLDVSRASVSQNTRLLVTAGAVKQVRLKGSNQMHFVMSEQPLHDTVSKRLEHLKRLKSLFEDVHQEKSLVGITKDRINYFRRAYDMSVASAQDCLCRLNNLDF